MEGAPKSSQRFQHERTGSNVTRILFHRIGRNIERVDHPLIEPNTSLHAYSEASNVACTLDCGRDPLVSIIVPVSNAQDTIESCAESLVRQDYPEKEIIFVDNESTDKTLDLLAKYPVKIAHEDKRGSYEARNKGISVSTGKILAFTDSDCVAKRNWLSLMVQRIMRSDVVGVRGHSDAVSTEGWAGIEQVAYSDYEKKCVGPNGFARTIDTRNFVVLREVMEKVSFFDSYFRSGGDLDLSVRLSRDNYKVAYESKAVVYHNHKTSLHEEFKRRFRMGKWAYHLLRKWGKEFFPGVQNSINRMKRFIVFFMLIIMFSVLPAPSIIKILAISPLIVVMLNDVGVNARASVSWFTCWFTKRRLKIRLYYSLNMMAWQVGVWTSAIKALTHL